jgi:N-acetylglucosamine kinase-like BadF-type ATPase
MVLAVDLGQSGARIRWNGGEHESARAKRAEETVLDVLRDIFEEATKRHPNALSDETVVLSLTAINGAAPDPKPYGKLAKEFFGAKNVAVIDDGLAGFVGALAGEDGVVISIGSGVVAVAGRRGKFAHSDGLGHIFGDLGGGYWLGKQGLERALATRQGRESDTLLLKFMEDEIALYDKLPSKVGAEAQSLCITSARMVLEAADRSIASALLIRDKGAEHLAKSIAAAWTLSGGMRNESFSLALLGGVSRNRGYEESIRRHVSALLPHARLVVSKGDQLDGAIRIASAMPADFLPLLRWWREA